MRRVVFIALALAGALGTAQPAGAGPVYLALGDSITFGETDLQYVPSFGDRGYVSRYADYLAGVNGVRPQVINLAIDGEKTTSFMTGVGRLPPVVGRTDQILAAENLNYAANPLVPQQTLFLANVAAQQAAGNTIKTVSVSLGFNDLFALAGMPNALSLIDPTLATYRANYSGILSLIRQTLPNADLFVLNYFNPFPADPPNPGGPIAAAGGPRLNAIIRELAGQYGAAYVDTFTPFVGREAPLTYIDEMPAGSVVSPPFGGLLPVGNVHPNNAGYDVIARQVEAAAVPEPSSLILLATGLAFVVRKRLAGPR